MLLSYIKGKLTCSGLALSKTSKLLWVGFHLLYGKSLHADSYHGVSDMLVSPAIISSW